MVDWVAGCVQARAPKGGLIFRWDDGTMCRPQCFKVVTVQRLPKGRGKRYTVDAAFKRGLHTSPFCVLLNILDLEAMSTTPAVLADIWRDH